MLNVLTGYGKRRSDIGQENWCSGVQRMGGKIRKQVRKGLEGDDQPYLRVTKTVPVQTKTFTNLCLIKR